MAKHAPILAFDAKMYRHFAIITIGLTGGIALLADGEKRQAVTETAVAVARYEPEKPKGPSLIIKAETRGGGDLDGFYREDGSDFGGSSGGGGGISLAALDRVSRIDERRLAELGLTLADFNALSPKEKERILRKLNQGMTTAERKKSIENATAQSLSRSGGGESADF